MGQLIVWNDSAYIQTLAKLFGDQNIVTDKKQLADKLSNWNVFDSLIILCELQWSSKETVKNVDVLYGIELAKELRRVRNITLPILFVSFLKLTEILGGERDIIISIGHTFCQLPVHPHILRSLFKEQFWQQGDVRRLSAMELNDIKSFYCSKEGILSHELHYLYRYLNYEIKKSDHDKVYSEFIQVIDKIHTLFLLDASLAKAMFQTSFPELANSNINEAISYVIRTGTMLANKYGNKKDGARVNVTDNYPWRVLFLDDEIDEEHQLIKQMRTLNINVECASNVQEATIILKNDWQHENNIMVVIADYRLYEKKSEAKQHQNVQGYQFLKDIAISDHLVRLVAFSGLQRRFLMQTFKHFNIRTEVKSKIDYLVDSHTMRLFCDEIIELGKENWDAIEALPSKCAGFARHLEAAYKAYRSHPDYEKMERNISLMANDYVREIQEQIKNNQEINIGSIEHIKSPLAKTVKDQEAYFKRFANYLVARRIALWLYASQKKGLLTGIDSRKIAGILTGQQYPTDAYRQILSTNLGLSLDDFPKNITIEERRWLQYDMEFNIFREIETIDSSFLKIQKHFSDFIKADRYLRDLISKNKFVLTHKYKNSDYTISFDDRFTPSLKTPTDVRVLYLILESRSDAKQPA